MSRLQAQRVVFVAISLLIVLAAAPANSAPDTIYALAIDPVTSTTVYMAEAGRILKSTDDGATWSVVASYGTFSDQGLAVHPLTPTTIYVPGGKTTDGGETWSPTGPSGPVSVVVVDPRTPTTVYAIPYICGMDDAGWCYDTEMLKSIDGGANWSGTGLVANRLAIDPASPSTLYAMGSTNPYDPALQGPGLFKSVNGGVTWSLIHEELMGPTIDPVTPTTVYAADGAGRVFKSINGGSTWAVIGSTGVSVKAFAIDPVNPAILYGLGASSGVIKSTDGGATWSVTGLMFGPPNYYVHPFAINPVTSTTLFASTEAGVFKSLDGGETWSLTRVMDPPGAVSWVSLAPATVVGGDSSTGTVVLNAPAPAGGTVVTLASGNPPTASVPSAVTVPSGSTTATFVVTTVPLQNFSITHPIYATAGGVTRSANLTITPAPLMGVASVSFSPSNVVGGGSSTGTILLNAPASGGGTVVTLSSGNTAAASVPTAVTVPSGTTTATFAVTTSPLPTATVVTISASGGGATRTATLTVNPPPPAVTLASLTLTPIIVNGVGTSTGTVTLSVTGGAVVTLSSSNTTAATLPASVTVPTSGTTATFPVTTQAVTTSTTVTITATLGGATRTAALTVNPPPSVVTLASLTLQPTSVKGGSPSAGTVRLSAAAPAGGMTVTLSSSHSGIAQVSSSITVLAGETSRTFPVSTTRPKSSTEVTISATLESVTKAATLTVRR